MQEDYLRNIPDFPDHTGYAVKEEKLADRYGKERYKLLTDTEEYKQIIFKRLCDIARHLRKFIPQGHPLWLEMRKKPRLTGSVSAEVLGLHDITAAAILGLPKIMWHNPMDTPYNPKWEDIRVRFKYGELPQTPMDPPGNVHCAQGKVKEPNALSYMMDMIPTMKFREMGSIDITEDQLCFYELVNVFKNKERITSLPDKLELVIAPDGDITVPSSCVQDRFGDFFFSNDTVDMALELKYPTFFRETTSSYFGGFDFYPLGDKCKLYDYPKPYYIPQTFLEMLALKRRSALFGCAGYGIGMRIWKIDMDTEYLSVLLSLLFHMFTKFIVKDAKVPTDYIFERYTVDSHMRQTYRWFIDRTLEISQTAKLYMVIDSKHTQRITQEIGTLSNNTYTKFPNLPEDVVPLYQLLCIYGRRLIYDYKKIYWVSAYTQFMPRCDNINVLVDTELTAFSYHIVGDIYSHLFDAFCGKYVDKTPEEEIIKLPVVRNKIIQAMEKFMFELYKLIFKLFGSPPFSTSPTIFYKLDPVVFHNSIVKQAVSLNERLQLSPLSDEMSVFGIEWIKKLIGTSSSSSSSFWSDKFEVSSYDVYRDLLLSEDKFNIDLQLGDENFDAPKLWQYERLLAVLILIK